jgi:hypothetical protein
MSSFSEQDPIDPDDPELDYRPLALRERAAKLGPYVSQGARSEPIRSRPIPRPVPPKNHDNDALWNPPDSKAINELVRRTRNLDRRAALLSVAARVAAVAGAVAVVAVVALLFVIMKPAPRQSVAGSTPPEITGSTSTAPPQPGQADVESKPALAEFKALVEPKPALAEFKAPVEPKPALAEFKALLAPPPSQPATHEQSEQLLHQFLRWGSKN